MLGIQAKELILWRIKGDLVDGIKKTFPHHALIKASTSHGVLRKEETLSRTDEMNKRQCWKLPPYFRIMLSTQSCRQVYELYEGRGES